MEKTYKILKLILLVLTMAALILGATRLYNALGSQAQAESLIAQPETPAEDTKAGIQLAPDFTVYDGEGNPHKLSDFIGKPVILNFWASWCGPCQMEMPDFEEKYLAYRDDVHFLMVNLTDGSQETVDTASAFIAEKGYTFPVYFDSDMDAAYRYSVSSIPMTCFIDEEGGLVTYRRGVISGEALQNIIDTLLA